MKPFRFQKFDILQSDKVFRVGTDGVLLGALCSCEKAEAVLEVGCGTGLISLMVAQRNLYAEILAIDINPAAVQLSAENFENSPFSTRLHARVADFNHFKTDGKYSLIVCNPPYFEENSSTKDMVARQKIMLSFSSLVSKSSQLLADEGIFSVIVPAEGTKEIITETEDSGLLLHRNIKIYGIAGGKIKRNILEFGCSPKKLVEEDFIIEKSPRKYSDQYLELTKAFHLFKN